MLPDYFQILEISQDASEMEIKRAYRQKAKQYHPGTNTLSDSLDKFILVNEAYEILIHKNTHEIYLQDFKSSHDPLKYEVYYYWINVARTRAAQHANMNTSDFLNSKFYKNTHMTPAPTLWIFMIVGILLMVGPYIFIVLFGANPYTVGSILAGLLLGTWFVVQASSGFQSMKKFIR